jgi:Helix-turn-helix domain of resolvase
VGRGRVVRGGVRDHTGADMSAPRIHNRDEIRALRREGLTLDAIAHRVGCGRTTVRRALYRRVKTSETHNQRGGICVICGTETSFPRPARPMYCNAHKHLRPS